MMTARRKKKAPRTPGKWPITEKQLLAVWLEWEKNGPPVRVSEEKWNKLTIHQRGAIWVDAIFELRDQLFPYQGASNERRSS